MNQTTLLLKLVDLLNRHGVRSWISEGHCQGAEWIETRRLMAVSEYVQDGRPCEEVVELPQHYGQILAWLGY